MATTKRQTQQDISVTVSLSATRPWYSTRDTMTESDRASIVTALKVDIIDILSKYRIKAEWDHIDVTVLQEK